MKEKVRIGIVGTSWWADAMHLPSITSHPNADLAAICGRNRDRAAEMAGKYGNPRIFTDYREMIDSGLLEAIVISVPDDLHYEMTLYAIDAGLHVCCEKPLALSVEQARTMYERAKAAGIKQATYFTQRWMPASRYVKRLVEEGYIGRCYRAEFHDVRGYARGNQYRWRFDGNRSLGIIGDLGAHQIDLARWFLGEVTVVGGQVSSSVDRFAEDGTPIPAACDSARALIELEGGCRGIVDVSAVAFDGDRGLDGRIALHGEAGTIEMHATMAAGLTLSGGRADEKRLETLRIPEDLLEGVDQDTPVMEQIHRVFTEHSAGCRAFVDAIIDDRAISPSLYDGLKAQEIINATIESSQSGRHIRIGT